MAYDFPASPILNQTFNNYVWDGEKWKLQSPPVTGAVRYDIAQSLNSAQRSQARANIDVTRKNYIINGAMMVSQENGTTAGATNSFFPVDMFSTSSSNAGTQWFAQIGAPTPAGSPNRIQFIATAADAAVGAGDYAMIWTSIEGLRLADLRAGTTAAKTVTLQFGVRAPAGTYCVALRNGGTANRNYLAEYVITASEANTDVIKSVTFTLDTTGTWAADNTAGITIFWTLMAGTTFQGAANTWQAGNLFGTANQYNFMGTINNSFQLFDVSLTEGSVAPPFQVPDYASELRQCQRYWQQRNLSLDVMGNAGTVVQHTIELAPSMRATPTFTLGGPFFAPVNLSVPAAVGSGTGQTFGFPISATMSATGRGYHYATVMFNARL